MLIAMLRTAVPLALLLVAAADLSGQDVVYVDADATGVLNDGSSWCEAHLGLDDALEVVSPGSGATIRVAGGIYVPDASGLSDPRDATFQMVSGIKLEGGFAGCGAPDPDERDPLAYPAVLSGDLDGDDPAGNEDNSYNVVTAIQCDISTLLDGFVVTGGNANGSPFSSIARFGGGMHIDGGGPVVQSCAFIGNTAEAGGAIANVGSSPRILNCLMSGNSATIDGGALFNDLAGPTLVNCTLSGNSAPKGAGIRNYAGVDLVVVNSILWGNVAGGMTGEGAQIRQDSSGTTFDYCRVEGWSGAYAGVGNTGGDPLFVDADGADDIYGTLDDDARLGPGSAAVDTGSAEGAPARDLDGFRRPCGEGFDIGAYERGACAVTPLPFVRADANADGAVNIADPSFVANFLFGILPATPPPCESAADANGDGTINIADPSFIANFVFGIGSAMPPKPPYPDCGTSEQDPLPCDASPGCEGPP